MNKTEHYNLNQWELHDRVMMQDFNADNAKIDAALKAEADARAAAVAAEADIRQAALEAEAAARQGGDLIVKLADITATKAQQQLSVSLSGIDFTAYRQIDVYFQAKMSSYTTVNFYLNSTSLSKEYFACSSGGSGSYSNSGNAAVMASWRCDPEKTLSAHLDLGTPCAGNPIFCQCSYAIHGSQYYDVATVRNMSSTVTWSTLRTLIFKSASTSDLIPAGARVTVVGLKV